MKKQSRRSDNGNGKAAVQQAVTAEYLESEIQRLVNERDLFLNEANKKAGNYNGLIEAYSTMLQMIRGEVEGGEVEPVEEAAE